MVHTSSSIKALKRHANEAGDDLEQFLVRELPPGRTAEATHLVLALQEAGARYDRYTAQRNEWVNYKTRRERLRKITWLVQLLSSRICELDILTRDDLANRVNPNDIPALIGLLGILSKQTAALLGEARHSGRPRELAEERWIVEVADIFENAFSRPATVWGSGDGAPARRGKFYRLLELSRPTSFARAGKLSVVQVGRVLKRREATPLMCSGRK